jgi:adenosylmethionine-8-amino-7-oxononanoate aminotransferase
MTAPKQDPETASAMRDAINYGTGVIKDGKRIDPQDFFTAPTYTAEQVAAAVKAALEGVAELVWSSRDSKEADYWGESLSDVARREKATAIRALAADPQAVARFVAQAATVPPKQ